MFQKKTKRKRMSGESDHDQDDVLDEVSDVLRHLVDLRVVELLDVVQRTLVLLGNKVDGNTLTTKTTTTTNSVNVVFAVVGQVVVDDERHLLHVNAAGQQIGGDENTRGAGAELAHDHFALALVHVAVHGRDGEVLGVHLLRQPVDLSSRVAEDDGLRDGERLVDIAQSLQLPVFTPDHDVELLDTLEGELFLLDENANGVAHELLRHLKHVGGHGGREQDDLDVVGHLGEDIMDLLLETTRQHLVGLVQNEELDVFRV